MTTDLGFPEDQPREEYIQNGGSALLYDWRKLSFAEHLLEIKKDMVANLEPEQKSFSLKEVDELLNRAFINVQHLIQGDGPHLGKFQLKRYIGELKDDGNKSFLLTRERYEHVDPEEYYALINN
ncbi:hypothetical protein PHABIO_326 [Pseudomonas phage Phabio]|uniref:Uncharacterized protein n=1 Tax=Pseudomonas phage Phabio TaxID=2006668 RepID=A0A1Y0T278_9CAUD|nr:hypothetical protein MZD05_gp326 [Pseudomonas phage Phabio]ARV76957.1 hypothetical protein PHABIO_326 [Pseudomonas phage Phabio]